MPETRVGMVAGTGSAQNLSRYLSLQRALDLLLTGRRLSSKLAQEWGLVSYISAPGREAVLKKALEVAATVVEASPDAQRATKALVLLGAEKGRLEAHKLTNTVPEYAAWGRGANVGEGTKAFAEKRKPSWHPLEKL
jgi:enoyl-CoA hydratase/carnithine racemase